MAGLDANIGRDVGAGGCTRGEMAAWGGRGRWSGSVLKKFGEGVGGKAWNGFQKLLERPGERLLKARNQQAEAPDKSRGKSRGNQEPQEARGEAQAILKGG